MAPSLSKLTPKHAAITGCAVAGALFYMYKRQSANALRLSPSVPQFVREQKKKDSGKEKAQIDWRFFKNLGRLIKILVPGFLTKEALYMIIVALSLVTRTYCDVWMIQNSTMVESAIINRDSKYFKQYLTSYIFAMPALSVVNNILKFGLNELKLRFRTRLSNHLYDQYLKGFTFYKMSNLDNRIANADQLLTQDVEKFCESIVDVYSNISKPILDTILYVIRLSGAVGFQAPFTMLVYLFVAGLCLTRLRRPIGKLTVVEQQLEGEYRFVNSRLIVNSEEIAFYQGNHREQVTVRHSFEKLIRHLRRLIMLRFSIGFVDNIVAKYMATVVGWAVVARPFLDSTNPHFAGMSRSLIMQEYYKTGRMMVKLAEAIGRLALAGREMTRLAGFTARVQQLIVVLTDLHKGVYVRTMVGAKQNTNNNNDLAMQIGEPNRRIPGSGCLLIKDNIIKFENVPLVTPNGDVLIEKMNFEVRSGMNVLVCGPNGCGKSSLFRTLGELWPLFGGVMTKPDKKKLFYIPQRPYMPIGTLRDQVLYPDSELEMKGKGFDDNHLLHLLEEVQLEYILEREGGWNSVQDWMDVLSGGEKQRIAMARLFYHKPQFAILDECTSAVSVDVEGHMYEYCRRTGITLFTVSHRKSLWTHHEYYLHMDGRGEFSFKPITDTTQEFGS